MAYFAYMVRHRDELGVNLLFWSPPRKAVLWEYGDSCRIMHLFERTSLLSESPQDHAVFFLCGARGHVGYALDGVNAAALAVRVVCLWIAVLFSWTEGDRTRLRLRPVSG